ncbi:hypothetical protein ACJZ2D_015027 [Fusarium nematophilum]
MTVAAGNRPVSVGGGKADKPRRQKSSDLSGGTQAQQSSIVIEPRTGAAFAAGNPPSVDIHLANGNLGNPLEQKP